MAQVPTLEQNVFPQQGPLPNASGADFGAQVGAAEQGVGEALGQAGDVMAKHVLAWQGLKNEATASDLDIQFQGDLGKLEDNFYALKGKAAADAQPKFESDLIALRQHYLGASPNPMVANMLSQSVGYSIGRSMRQSGQYAGDQTKAWMIQSADSRNQLLVNLGARNYADPQVQAEVSAALDAGVKNWGELNGADENTQAVKRAEFEAALQKNRIENAKTFIQSHSIGDQASALLGVQQGTPTAVGGANYHRFVLATEFGTGQNDPNNPDHQGPVQASAAWMAHFNPGGDRNNLQDSLKGLDNETAENKPKLEAALKRPVTDSDLYLAHQQGLAGAIALLTNPDAPAAQSVPLANIAANIPANSGLDPNTITGGQFAALYNAGEASGAITPANGTGVDKQLAAAVSVLPEGEKQALTKDVLSAWHTQDAAFREQTRFQQEQNAKAQKQQYDDVMNGAKAAINANWAQPQQAPPFDIAKFSQTPWAQKNPQAVQDLLNYQKNLDNKPNDGIDKATTSQLYRGYLNGTATTKDFQDAFAPPDGTPGKISKGSLDFLMKAAEGKDDPTVIATNKLKDKFVKDNETAIGTGANAMTPDAKFRFDFDFEQAWQAKIAKGENPKDLITPGNKDYFGSLANLSHYSLSAADQLQAEADAQKPGLLERLWTGLTGGGEAGPAIPADLPAGTKYLGKTKDGRDAYLKPDGSKVAVGSPATTPAPAEAPVAASDTGPAVPNTP
jgi:hypothetical protein